MLRDFIRANRDELIARARAKVASRAAPRASDAHLTRGVPDFLTRLGESLGGERAGVDGSGTSTADAPGRLHGEFSVSQVVHDYGDVCQAVAELAAARQVPIDPEDLRALTRCLDGAIAEALTAHAAARENERMQGEVERLGALAHELRNLIGVAALAFHTLKKGNVGINGSTGAVLQRSLVSLGHLVDRSLSEVRLAAQVLHKEQLALGELVEEMAIGATMEARQRGMELTIDCSATDASIDVDRHLIGSAVQNLLQNALKFSRPQGHIRLVARSAGERVILEVEDECGGLPTGAAGRLFAPFEQHGGDRSGLGLGLTICRRAVESNGGVVSVRDLPGKGCVFSIDLPRASGPDPLAELRRTADPSLSAHDGERVAR